MKTRFFAVLSVVFLFVSTSFAGVDETMESKTVSPAGKLLKKEIRYPLVAREKSISGTVYVVLKKGSDEKLHLEGLRFDNETLSIDVLNQIEKLEPKLAGLMETDMPQTFKFTFVSK